MRVVRFLVGVALLPFCAAATWAVVELILQVQPETYSAIPGSLIALVAGFVAWLLVYFALPRPVVSYVLAHELSHALWALTMGARVSGLQVSSEGGGVAVSKTNFLIILAPYFFPFYTMCAVSLHGLVSLAADQRPYQLYWLAAVGLTLSFHYTFTISALMRAQEDIRLCGRLFSYTVIYLLNVLQAGLWIVFVTAARIEDLSALLGERLTDVVGSGAHGLRILFALMQ